MGMAAQDRSNRVRHTLLLFITGLPLVACCGIWLVANWVLADFGSFSADDVPPEVIEANAEITLPPTAADIFAHHEGFRDIFIEVRFSMAAADLDRFLQSTQCKEPLVPTDPKLQQANERTPEWWKPMDARRLQECSGGHDQSRQHIMVDMSNPTQYIVYVSASQS